MGLFLHLRRSFFLGVALPQLVGFSFVAATALCVPSWAAAVATILAFALFAAWKSPQSSDGVTLETLIALGYTISMAGVALIFSLT